MKTHELLFHSAHKHTMFVDGWKWTCTRGCKVKWPCGYCEREVIAMANIQCRYCPMEISGYESHIKTLIERRPVNTNIGVKRISALERAGWIFPDGVEITDQVISGLCPACSVADSEA